jgi:hypothetical protein
MIGGNVIRATPFKIITPPVSPDIREDAGTAKE